MAAACRVCRSFVLEADRSPTTPRPPITAIATTPTILPPGALSFGGSGDKLVWDGPDDRVYSNAQAHCGSEQLTKDFGMPAYIGVDRELGFWSIGSVQRMKDWRWTGYSHDGWQIWQGDDATIVYIVREGEPRIAFEYRAYGCI